MKRHLPLLSLRFILAAALLVGALLFPLHAADATSAASGGTLVPVSAKTDAAWLAKARAAYGLDRCPVCGDKIDAKSPEYVFQQAGQPDRLVRLCGDMECVPGFTKDSAKYLKLIDDAASAKAATAKK